jgi:endoglucanase
MFSFPSPVGLSMLMIALGAVCAAQAAENNAASAGPDVFVQNQRLGRGVNIIGYDPLWRDRGRARFQDEHFRLIREKQWVEPILRALIPPEK